MFNKNFYNNFHGNTFQNTQYTPPPPPPPAYFLPAQVPNDEEFIKQFDVAEPRKQKVKTLTSISTVRNEIYNLLQQLKELKNKECLLSENIDSLSEEQWNANLMQVQENKTVLNSILEKINGFNFEVLHNLLAKRLAKRVRLRRQRLERKNGKEEWLKQMQEKSRKIDEKLQKTQDDIKKAKQEEESKIQADLVLKETLRKKHDAKRYLVKLEALMKLRRARANTARGRGEAVSEIEDDTFNTNIEKLKALWRQRLSLYEAEEGQLRITLETPEPCESESATVDYSEAWKQALFGGGPPQVSFHDVAQFVSVRCEWDKFLDSNGTTLPAGWVSPSATNLSIFT